MAPDNPILSQSLFISTFSSVFDCGAPSQLHLFHKLWCGLRGPANYFWPFTFIAKLLGQKMYAQHIVCYSSYTPCLNLLNRFLSQMQNWHCVSKATSNLIHTGLETTTLKWSSLFHKYQPPQSLLSDALQPSPTLQTNKRGKKHPGTDIFLIVHIVSQCSYCFYFSLFYPESLSVFKLLDITSINSYPKSWATEELSSVQSQIFNHLFIKWLPAMWQAGDAVILSTQSRADHLHLNSKTPNPKLSLLFFTDVTCLVLLFALLLMSSWFSNTLLLAWFPEKQTPKRSACTKLVRECSWDPQPWKSVEEGKIGKREKLDCDAVSWGLRLTLHGVLISELAELELGHWSGAWPWARQLSSVQAIHVRNWQLRMTVTGTLASGWISPSFLNGHLGITSQCLPHSRGLKHINSQRNTETGGKQTKILILSQSLIMWS